MTHPTDWCWDPMPAVDGWFAVIRCWDPDEGMFPGAAWATGGKVLPPANNGMATDGSGHAGPFPTVAEARKWAYDHDPEAPSWMRTHPRPRLTTSLPPCHARRYIRH